MKRSNTNFQAMANALYNDPALRGIRHTQAFTETLRMFHLGLLKMSKLAVVAFLETVRRSAAIERITSISEKMDVITQIAAVTPNINSGKDNSVVNFEELVEDEE